MPANSTGWIWHCLARETGCLGHLFSPDAQRGPWPWFPYALDNGAFACWEPKTNTFDETKWTQTESAWKRLLFWAQTNQQKPLWSIVPDRPGNWEETCQKWPLFAGIVEQSGIPLAVAVQDGATPEGVRALSPQPEVIAVGGSTEWKWETVAMWAREFPRVHLLRCNSPERLNQLAQLGVESTDGTGWNRGDRKQTAGLEEFCRKHERRFRPCHPLTPHACRSAKDAKLQMAFA
jgi:hypothetical protein